MRWEIVYPAFFFQDDCVKFNVLERFGITFFSISFFFILFLFVFLLLLIFNALTDSVGGLNDAVRRKHLPFVLGGHSHDKHI